MINKEIKSEINEKLNQGSSKSDLYDQFRDKVDHESLKKYLASRPSYELKLKFKRMHLILSIIWGLFILLEMIGILDLIASFDLTYFVSLIVSIYLTINIWRFDGKFFLSGIIWFVLTIFNSFSELDSIYQYDPDFNLILVISVLYSLILLVGILLMYHIRRQVFSYYKWFQPELDRNDEIQFENPPSNENNSRQL